MKVQKNKNLLSINAYLSSPVGLNTNFFSHPRLKTNMEHDAHKDQKDTIPHPSKLREKRFLQRITDFSDWTLSTWIYVIIFFLIAGVTGWLVYKMIQDDRYLFGIVINGFAYPVSEMGKAGWILFLIFMAIQGLIIPIPSELVLLSSGMIWGVWFGFGLGIVGSMLAGTLCYWVSMKGGRPIVEKMIGKENIELVDVFIHRFGTPIILIARAFPFMAFDPISYVSGLLKFDLKQYTMATLIGSVSRCIFYAWLGSTLIGTKPLYQYEQTEIDTLINSQSRQFNLILTLLICVLGGAFLLYQYLLTPYLKRKRNQLVLSGKKTEVLTSLQSLGDQYFHHADFLVDVISSLNISQSAKILDVGTGRGKMAIVLALLGFSPTTGEPEGDNWANWRENAQKVKIESQIQFQYLRAEQLPFEDQSFDLICSFGTFHHVENPKQALQEFIRVVKRKGTIVLFEHTPEGIAEIRSHNPDHPPARDPREFVVGLPIKMHVIANPTMNAYVFQKKFKFASNWGKRA